MSAPAEMDLPPRPVSAPERRAAAPRWQQLRLVAMKEFADRLQHGWVLACSLVWLGAIALTSLFGLVQIGSIGIQGYERTTASLLSLVQYIVPLLGLLLGHDLIVSEREDKTLALALSGGLSRRKLLGGKFLGGALALAVPLVLGFVVAGALIGLAARDTEVTPFLKLAGSGLLLGLVFLGIGLLLSTLSRTRVQALVLALLAWCAAVFVFDLAAMGTMLVARGGAAAREVETVTDATHVASAADLHAAYESGDDAAARAAARTRERPVDYWLWINPLDAFRALNLPRELAIHSGWAGLLLSGGAWLILSLTGAAWRLQRLDL